MIWTLIAFAITFFVLKRYAFGPIQKLIDERRERIRAVGRGGRPRPRGGAQPARGAQGADRPGPQRGRVDPRRGAQDRRRPAASGCARRPRRTASAGSRRPSGRSSRRRCRRSTSSGRRSPTLSLEAAEKITRKTLDRRRPAAPDRRGARRDRLLAAGGEPLIAAAAAHLRPRALRGRAGQGPARRSSASELGRPRATRSARCPSSRPCSTNPETESRVKADVLEQILGGADELVRNFVRARRREGPRRGDPRDRRGVRGARRRAGARPRRRAHDRAASSPTPTSSASSPTSRRSPAARCRRRAASTRT